MSAAREVCAAAGWRVLRAQQGENTELVLDILNQAYRDKTARGWTTEGHLITGDRMSPAGLEAVFADASTRLLVLEETFSDDSSAPVPRGVIAITLVTAAEDRVGLAEGDGAAVELGKFAVHPEHQSKGYGRALMRAAEAVGQTDFAARFVQLHVLSCRPEIISWYIRNGFELIPGVTADFPPPSAGEGVSIVSHPLIFHLYRKSLN